MAKLSSDKTYVTVEKGDTLWAIARDYKSYSNNATYQQLAAINGISNPNLIYVNQNRKYGDVEHAKHQKYEKIYEIRCWVCAYEIYNIVCINTNNV